MSIRDAINARLSERPLRLLRLRPLNEKDPKRRTVLMSEEIARLVYGPWPEGPMGARCARLRADLENFITAEHITVCWEPYEARDEQIGRLNPVHDEIWDLRSQEPAPGLRVFFCFAEKDVMVALTCAPRSIEVSWLDRLPLLDRESRRWRDAMVECGTKWRQIFPAHDPHTGENVNEYLTGARILL